MIKKVKELRVHIDELSKMVKGLKNSYEVSKAYDSLILSKAWLGKTLGVLGTESPYKSGYKTVADIEPTADTGSFYLKQRHGVIEEDILITDGIPWSSYNRIEKIDWLRTEIERTIKLIPDSYKFFQEQKALIPRNPDRATETREQFVEWMDQVEKIPQIGDTTMPAENHLIEAKFWLGFELQRIKEDENS